MSWRPLRRAVRAALRLYLGTIWISQWRHKVTDPSWVQTGDAVLEFWESAVAVPSPPARPAVSFAIYRSFLRWLIEARLHRPIALLQVVAQGLVGAALLLGWRVRLAATVGLILNLNFSLAGGRGHNPLMLVAETVLAVAPDDAPTKS
jgi:thiosulfate dehydrogenase [quinone] large subunit